MTTADKARTDRNPTLDERMGMAWWNGMTPRERTAALNSATTATNPMPSPADAWAWWKARETGGHS